MKITISIIAFCFCFSLSFSQNYQVLEEVDNICSQRGFAPTEDTGIADDNILSQIVVFSNFTFEKCPDINPDDFRGKNRL